jgi:hypothetical protein
MPMVKALPSIRPGGPALEFRNDLDHEITVILVLACLGDRQMGNQVPLMSAPVCLTPGAHYHYLALGDNLRKLLKATGKLSTANEARIVIELILEPANPDQSPGVYCLSWKDDGFFTAFVFC